MSHCNCPMCTFVGPRGSSNPFGLSDEERKKIDDWWKKNGEQVTAQVKTLPVPIEHGMSEWPPPEPVFIIVFEDTERSNETFVGEDAEERAHSALEFYSQNWNASLFKQVAVNWNPQRSK